MLSRCMHFPSWQDGTVGVTSLDLRHAGVGRPCQQDGAGNVPKHLLVESATAIQQTIRQSSSRGSIGKTRIGYNHETLGQTPSQGAEAGIGPCPAKVFRCMASPEGAEYLTFTPRPFLRRDCTAICPHPLTPMCLVM